MPWIVQVSVAASDAELTTAAWWTAGATPTAVEETAGPDGTVRYVAGYGSIAAATTAARLVGGTVSRAPDVDWDPVHRGRPSPVVAGREIDLDVGATFGWGGHPTTRLVLDLLVDLVRPGTTVLDVGSGSGVLSIAARLIGSGPVLAIDLDQEAVATTIRNAVRNGVGDGVTARRGGPASVAGCFDLVLANLTRAVHDAEATAITARCGPGGAVVVSGLLDGEAPAVAPRYTAAGLSVTATGNDAGWTAIVLRRP